MFQSKWNERCGNAATGALKAPLCEILIHQRPLVDETGHLVPGRKVKFGTQTAWPVMSSSLKPRRLLFPDMFSLCSVNGLSKRLAWIGPLFACVSLQTTFPTETNPDGRNLTPANDWERIAHRKPPLTPQYLREVVGDRSRNVHFTSWSFTR